MAKKNTGSRRNHDKKIAQELMDSMVTPTDFDPIKRQLKINQFDWTENQKNFFKVALHNDTKIVFVDGPAGTSKTLLSVYCALQLLNRKTISDIMYLRSSVESSDQKIGFLPGSADEKLAYFKIPLLEKLDELLPDTTTERLEKENRISMFPINFARGVNWKNKCIIVDEAQNCTLKELTTVLTRLGEGSICYVLADPMQTDLGNGKSGFSRMFSLFLKDQESMENGIYTFEFTEDDIMRSELVKFLVKKLKHIN
jgi:phosphate starvation-inducible PhoH-like protein|tara:strand:+ start:669 stop:1433 length:765 start_codon:yes stop_codon:yes gene_type:complete